MTEGAKANLIGKGVPPEKISVAPPWYDDADMRHVAPSDRDAVRSHEGWHGRFVVMFAGNMGVLQGLENLVHAAQRLPADAGILIAMVGDGMDLPRLKQLVIELELTERVTFVERQAVDRHGAILRGRGRRFRSAPRVSCYRLLDPGKNDCVPRGR